MAHGSVALIISIDFKMMRNGKNFVANSGVFPFKGNQTAEHLYQGVAIILNSMVVNNLK